MILENKLGIRDAAELARTDRIWDREMYMKGIDHSYYYEGYALYKAEECL